MTRPQLSIVIPLLNEEESLPELHAWLLKVFTAHNLTYEVVFVDDGSSDNSWNVISSLCATNQHTYGLKFQRNYGKSAALQTAFQHVNGEVVITMDADLQDSPDEIPELYRMITQDGYDLVSGWKQKRFDPITKTLPTKLYNWAARRITGIYLHDFNCGLKAYKRTVVKSIEVYGDMHRYMPALAKYAGFKKIGEKVVQHQARKYGTSKFGINRFLNGPLDLMTVAFMGKFGKKPMHFFGALGTLMFIVGFGFGMYLGIDKLFIHTRGIRLSDRTEFYISLVAMLMGLQFFLTGFLAELIGRNSSSRNNYLLEDKQGWD